MALSMANEAPWPELGEGACTASPTRVTRPRDQRGLGGMLSIAPTNAMAVESVVARTCSAGLSLAKTSRSQLSQLPVERAFATCRSWGSSAGTLANQAIRP